MIDLPNINSLTMQQIIDGTLNIEYLSVPDIIKKYGHMLTEKELELLKGHCDGD